MDELYRQLLDGVDEGVYAVDRDRRISFWNPAAARISGHAAAQVVGTLCPQGLLQHTDDSGRVLCGDHCPLLETMRTGETTSARVYLRHADGHRVPVLVRAAPLRDADGRIVGAVESFRDDSPHLAALQRIEELEQVAFLDPLTGLGNRRYTQQSLAASVDQLNRYGWRFGVLFLDIDRFRDVNNRWGHVVGDAVLLMVSRNLVASLRQSDFAGRWGGDELLAIIPNVDEPGLRRIVERLRGLLRASASPLPEGEVTVTVSIGALLAASGATPETLVAEADTLMYRSKRAGGDGATYGVCAPGLVGLEGGARP